MIPYEVVVPDHGSSEGDKLDGVAIEVVRERNPESLYVTTWVGVIVNRTDRLEWFAAQNVQWGAPLPIDTRPL